MDFLEASITTISTLIASGLSPIPALARFGLPYSIFDIVGSLRLALVIRQIQELERHKAEIEQRRLVKEGSPLVRKLEKPYFVKDVVTILTVIYGGEVVCSPWLKFTPSFLTTPAYPLLFISAQAFINLLPSVPEMSIHTELPFSFFDALTRTFLLTTMNHNLICKHASPAIASSPWALCVTALIFANAGFFFVNLFQMLSPYGWTIQTPPELQPGGWRTMDLWIAPVITATHAFLTQAQPAWVPYHTHVITRVGKSTLFGTVQAPVFVEDSGEWTELSVSPMNETEARAFCALIIAILFLYRVTVNFGIDWAKGAVKGKPKKVIRSKTDGKRLSKDIRTAHGRSKSGQHTNGTL